MSTSLANDLQPVLRLGALMLRNGATAFRARQAMAAVAHRLGVNALSVQLCVRSLVATGRRSADVVTLVMEVGIPAVDTRRLTALDQLAHAASRPLTAGELDTRLTDIE